MTCTHNSAEQDKEDEDIQYTHIAVPLPGHNFDCVDLASLKSLTSPKKGEAPKDGTSHKRGKRLFRMLKSNQKVVREEVKEEPEQSSKVIEKGEKRNCPIFCAICLMEYELSDRVTWSSNASCTHVFHEDCIVNWLVTLGKTKSKMQRFSRDPTEAQLLNYQPECPCCRQNFIAAEQLDLPEDVLFGEDNV